MHKNSSHSFHVVPRGLVRRHADQRKRQEIKCTVILVQEHIMPVHFSSIFQSLHYALSLFTPIFHSSTSEHHPVIRRLQHNCSSSSSMHCSLNFPPYLISLFVLDVSLLPIILLGNSCGEAAQMKISTEAAVPQQIRRIRNNAPSSVCVCSQRTLE